MSGSQPCFRVSSLFRHQSNHCIGITGLFRHLSQLLFGIPDCCLCLESGAHHCIGVRSSPFVQMVRFTTPDFKGLLLLDTSVHGCMEISESCSCLNNRAHYCIWVSVFLLCLDTRACRTNQNP